MSYNVRHGLGLDGKVDLPRIASVVANAKPDLVGLQEIDVKTHRVKGVDEAAELGRLTGLHPVFGKAIDYQGGGYGVMTLSKEKPISVRKVPLPGGEKRLLLLAEFADCWFGTMHLAVDSEQARLESIALIRDAVAKLDKPVYLTGDWNAKPDSSVLKGLGEFLTVLSDQKGRTFHGSGNASVCIDYVAVDSRHASFVKVRSARTVEERQASDHAPITVEVCHGK